MFTKDSAKMKNSTFSSTSKRNFSTYKNANCATERLIFIKNAPPAKTTSASQNKKESTPSPALAANPALTSKYKKTVSNDTHLRQFF
jgi:hypothetical protein